MSGECGEVEYSLDGQGWDDGRIVWRARCRPHGYKGPTRHDDGRADDDLSAHRREVTS